MNIFVRVGSPERDPALITKVTQAGVSGKRMLGKKTPAGRE